MIDPSYFDPPDSSSPPGVDPDWFDALALTQSLLQKLGCPVALAADTRSALLARKLKDVREHPEYSY